MTERLILKRASSASRPSGVWKDEEEEYDVLGAVVGRTFPAAASPVGSPWMWTLAFGHHEDQHPDARPRADPRGRDGGTGGAQEGSSTGSLLVSRR
jgi:hypothetical protein